MNKTLLSPRAFRKQPLREQMELQKVDFSDWRGFREDIGANQKKSLLRDLLRKLKVHDFWYQMVAGSSPSILMGSWGGAHWI